MQHLFCMQLYTTMLYKVATGPINAERIAIGRKSMELRRYTTPYYSNHMVSPLQAVVYQVGMVINVPSSGANGPLSSWGEKMPDIRMGLLSNEGRTIASGKNSAYPLYTIRTATPKLRSTNSRRNLLSSRQSLRTRGLGYHGYNRNTRMLYSIFISTMFDNNNIIRIYSESFFFFGYLLKSLTEPRKSKRRW